MNALVRWLGAFATFWYRFIVGDDWTIAATVAVGLLLTGLLRSAGLQAWWLLPLMVITILGVSVRRVRPT